MLDKWIVALAVNELGYRSAHEGEKTIITAIIYVHIAKQEKH